MKAGRLAKQIGANFDATTNAMPSNKHLTILSLCDYSGSWSQPYADDGYNVIRIDLKHGQDVRMMEYIERVHGILAAPPCTVFANSGARWERTHDEMLEGLSVVDACLRLVAVCRPRWWVLENPIGKLKRYLGKPTMMFNPCDYGDPYTKKTCLWGEFTPPMGMFIGGNWSVEPTEGSKMHTQYGGKSDKTKELRSITPPGFAKAFYLANP